MHSAKSQFQGDSLYYMEIDLGTQTNYATPLPPFPPFLSAWTDRPVTFKKKSQLFSKCADGKFI